MIRPVEMEQAVPSARWVRGLWMAVLALLVAGPVAATFVPADRDVALEVITASSASADRARTMIATITSRTEIAGEPHVTRISLWVDNDTKTARFVTTDGDSSGPGIETVATPERTFVRLPEEARARAGGKAWAAAPTPPDPRTGERNPGSMGQQLLDHLAGAEGAIEERGSEQIRGVRTTRYLVEIDVDQMRERERGRDERARERGHDVPSPAPVASAEPADVWIDDEGRPRRVRLTTTLDDGEDRNVLTNEAEYDWDEPVSITVPNPDEVHEVATLSDAFRLLYEGPPAPS